ncbi:DUF3108 domain-containing protein [Pararhodonellum marinum]|uniref:DUF3108 domain-containing protein n=1 Tax=Pararhodonellum marinum TaxID=2755358 RepID=UPI00189007A9|nr:DUF3108 domain-containing protein [Pararhodonellum marinum]
MRTKIISSIALCLFLWSAKPMHSQQKNQSFNSGEELLFNVSYGWIGLADAKLVISDSIFTINDHPTYKIDVFGKTKGPASWFGKVNDNWGTYLDTAKILPHQSYRHIQEGKYRKNERVHLDQKAKKAKMELYDRENKELVETKSFDLPGTVQDIVSGFYYLRTIDLKKFKSGDAVTIPGFFDKEIYNLNLIYQGKERISTPVGTFDTYIFTPQMPPNKLFRGEFPVKVWISDDKNKIPVKIKANLVVGSLDMEIVSAKGLRNNLVTKD